VVIVQVGWLFLPGTCWPDLIVSKIIGTLGLLACYSVFKKAIPEFRSKA